MIDKLRLNRPKGRSVDEQLAARLKLERQRGQVDGLLDAMGLLAQQFGPLPLAAMDSAVWAAYHKACFKIFEKATTLVSRELSG
jgi:hypothetical protein